MSSNLIFASVISAIVEVSVTHPLDRIKTGMQEATLKQYKSNKFLYITKKIYTNDKFYRGFYPRLLGIIPMRTVYWNTMNYTRKITENRSSYIKYMAPGIVAGFTQTLVDCPIEIYKINMMTKLPNKLVNFLNPYQGFIACVSRNMLFAIPVSIGTIKYGKDYPFLSGFIGGMIGSIISHPFDVIKTEKQRYKQNETKLDLIKFIKENPLKLYNGVGIRTMMGCINMGIGFYIYNLFINR